MRNENQETIADIVAEVRARAKAWPDPSLVQYDERLADRIEAAANREREAGAEAAQICGEIGEMVGREEARKEKVTDCNRFGNVAKMLDALEQAKRVLHCAIVAGILTGDDVIKSLSAVISALSDPPRECDVGTPEEQSARFDAQCRKHMGCLTCPFRSKDGGVHNLCEFAWAHMPYEEGGAK